MRRGATATHIFKIMIGDLNPKDVQVTYRQGNRIVLQKHMADMEIYTLLYRGMTLDTSGNLVIEPGVEFIHVDSPTVTIVSSNVVVQDRCMYFTTEDGLYPGLSLLVKLKQEETFLFDATDYAAIQVRVITQDGTSLVSTITKIKIEDCLDENLLPLEEYTPFTEAR